MANALKYGQVDIPGIPEKEPVFILRAQDVLSLPLVAEYRKMAMGAGCSMPHLEAIDRVYRAMRIHQTEYPTKLPDS